MIETSTETLVERAFEQGEGVLRLSPNWVPRSFCIPGRRIKLHPSDYYALGMNRGGIDERWLSSTTPAQNGPLTGEFEGLSFMVCEDGTDVKCILLRDAIAVLKDKILGHRIWEKYQSWPMYSKFFDNQNPLPFHIHHNDEMAALVGQLGKPEAYYFPPQLNNHGGDFPYTFLGLSTSTSRKDIEQCLQMFTQGDNHITRYSSAVKLLPGTGWDVPPGLLHAPGSMCTYEPQKASDVFAMYESLVNDSVIEEELLWNCTPKEKIGDYEHLLNVIDWPLNQDPELIANRYMEPRPVLPKLEMKSHGYQENWICYKSDDFSAKELTVMPGNTVTIHDSAAYGMIMMQGHGRLNNHPIETPSLIRFGQETNDEFFVSEQAARNGITIRNESACEPIVMLKHFGPENPDLD